jgi:SRSO17 transposase
VSGWAAGPGGVACDKRSLGEQPAYWYYISNAPWSTWLPTFVWLSGVRGVIEQCFEEGKTELGMDHYEARQYPGWHRHMWSCTLAHFFLWRENIRLEGKSPGIDPVSDADATGSSLTIAHVYS